MMTHGGKTTVPLAFLENRFIPLADAALTIVDAGFVSGATIVDNARTYGGSLFRWTDHLARFRRDCQDCYVPLSASDAELTHIAEQLLEHNRPLADGRELQLVTFATPGSLGFYTNTPNGPPTLGMMTYPVPISRYRRFFSEGVTLAVVGTHPMLPDDLLPPRIKHRSRLHWHIADQLAKQRDPQAVGVVLNRGWGDTAIGGIVGVTTRGEILVPPSGFVQDSISMKVLAELRTVRPAQFCYDDPDIAELLLVGTGFGIVNVRRVLGTHTTREFVWPGAVGTDLIAAWSRLVGVEDIREEFTK